jgi:hypothetical protein
LARHCLLHFAVFLKRLVADQRHLLILAAAQTRALQYYFAASINHITSLMAVPMHRLAAPETHFLADLGLHDPLNNGQAQLRRKGLNVGPCSGHQLLHGQLRFQSQSPPILGFLFGLFIRSSVFSHRWFSWLFVFLLQPFILFDERQENHSQFQLSAGHLHAGPRIGTMNRIEEEDEKRTRTMVHGKSERSGSLFSLNCSY